MLIEEDTSMKKSLAVIFGAALSLAAGSASAAIDLTTVTAAFTDLGTAQVAVGGLLLVAAVTAVSYKWIKGMLFG
mgnify:CR=1 FL=1